MSRFRSLAFPIALALILGGLSSWLGRVSQISETEVPLNPNEPQYLITQPNAKRFDEQGLLHQQLGAPRAWQLPDQKNVYFEQPDLHLFTQGVMQYRVTGQQARYELASKKVFFEQKVTLQKTADAERPAAQVDTEALIVDTVAQTAQTDAPVHYQYGQSTGTANGMNYNHQTGVLNLPANVKALIYAKPM